MQVMGEIQGVQNFASATQLVLDPLRVTIACHMKWQRYLQNMSHNTHITNTFMYIR